MHTYRETANSQIGGINGCHMRRNVGYVLDCERKDYIQSMKDAVIAIMVEKKGCMENLEKILSLDDIDMVQFGPCL